MESPSVDRPVQKANRKSVASKQKSADKYRSFNNHRSFDRLQTIMSIVTRNIGNVNFPYDLDVLGKGRRLLTESKFEDLDNLIIQLKTAEFNLSVQFATEVVVSEFEEVTLLEDRLHQFVECVDISDATDICIKQERTYTCEQSSNCECTAYPSDRIPEFQSPTGLCIYSGPGCGKTTLIESVDVRYRGMIRDTDHLQSDTIPPRSIVLTNRPDVFRSFPGCKIAHIPHRDVWLRRCRTKCKDAKNHWYDDMLNCVDRCLLIRSDAYLSEVIRLRAHGQRKRRLQSSDGFTFGFDVRDKYQDSGGNTLLH